MTSMRSERSAVVEYTQTQTRHIVGAATSTHPSNPVNVLDTVSRTRRPAPSVARPHLAHAVSPGTPADTHETGDPVAAT
ncbi:MAG: hypothetical protein WBD41_01535 [Rhodococcus sp. (in: high G+C Gram-positive bacteria)]|uniref:hypothetical protein n=1 Tax=unclassified Rhodococcus (in: high G+C Gram-positive bacteria) TaxID=192944 RepID=UPI0012F73F16|nr:hypothetical protein [Rhodococcus sp. AW25M09]